LERFEIKGANILKADTGESDKNEVMEYIVIGILKKYKMK